MSPRLFPAVSLLLLVAGCASTTVSTVWKTPDPLPPPFARIITLVVNATPSERRAGEEQLAGQLRPGQGIPGYTLISDEALRDRDKVRQIIQSNGIDGAVVLRLVASDRQTTYYPPEYRPIYGYEDYYGSFLAYSPGYALTNTFIRAEVSVYSVKEGKLLWAGATNTPNPANMRDLVTQIAKASAAELRKQGMVR